MKNEQIFKYSITYKKLCRSSSYVGQTGISYHGFLYFYVIVVWLKNAQIFIQKPIQSIMKSHPPHGDRQKQTTLNKFFARSSDSQSNHWNRGQKHINHHSFVLLNI